jgi:hypothetical protein
MPGYKKPKMGHKKPKMAHGKKPKMAHGKKPKMAHGKKPQFNAKLKKAAAEGKLDNNPSFKSAVENAKPKMAHGKKPKMVHGNKPKMYGKPKMYNKKPFMMEPGSKEINSPGSFKANEPAMMFKNNMPKQTDEKSKRSGLPASSTDVLPKGEPTKPHSRYAELGYMKAHKQEETGDYIAIDGSAHKTPLEERRASARAAEKAQKIMRAKRSGKKPKMYGRK